jgi:hypothetical protein
MNDVRLSGFFDEMEKIAVSLSSLRNMTNSARQFSGRGLTMEGQAAHRELWARQQAIKAAMKPRVDAYKASLGRTALKKKPAKTGLLPSLFGRSPMARA